MGPQTERFEMRLDQALLDRIDAWSKKQDDTPSRAEAVRRLIEAALATTSDTPLILNNSEKLIVSLLCELHKGLKIKGELEPDFIMSAIYGGHYWGLKWKYEGLLHNYHDNEKTLHEVLDILDMWSFIESAHDELTSKDKDYIKTNAKHYNVKFPGFDGNNESNHRTIALFLIKGMDRFTEFKNRGDLNSHFPTLERYRQMLSVFMPMRKKLAGRNLDAKEIVEILKTQ